MSGSDDNTVCVWPIASGARLHKLQQPGSGAVLCVAVTPDGQHIVSASVIGATLWSLTDGREVRVLAGAECGVTSVAVTPDGQYIVCGCNDGAVTARPLVSGEEVRRLGKHDSEVSSVAVTLDGQRVVSGSYDGTVRMWPMAPEAASPSNEEMQRPEGHDGPVYSVAVTPDGQHIVSGGSDNTVRVRSSPHGLATVEVWAAQSAVLAVQELFDEGDRILVDVALRCAVLQHAEVIRNRAPRW